MLVIIKLVTIASLQIDLIKKGFHLIAMITINYGQFSTKSLTILTEICGTNRPKSTITQLRIHLPETTPQNLSNTTAHRANPSSP